EEYPTGRAKSVRLRKSLRPGPPGRGDVRLTRSPTFGCGAACARACQHGLPCVEFGGVGIGGGFLGGAPARCSKSDGRMIYGVSEAITGMVLRRLEKSRVV
ncbi:unnamed protein product, partial [Prunus brigantina]